MNQAILGIVIGITLTQLLYVAWAHMELKNKKTELTQQLQDSLSLISESHNSLIESIKVLDKKVNDATLKVDVALQRKSGVPNLSNYSAGLSKSSS